MNPVLEEQLQKRQEDLSKVVEPLVDSISDLIISTVTAEFENVQTICITMAERTNQVVTISQQAAISSADPNLQNEVIKAINDLAECIEGLVLAFNDVISNSSSKTKEAFAGSAKNVGDSINRLVQATDETSQKKILAVTKEAAASIIKLQECVLDENRIVEAAKFHTEKVIRLLQVVNLAIAATADEKKKNLLKIAGDEVKSLSPQLIQAAKQYYTQPTSDSAKSAFEAKVEQFNGGLNNIITSAKIVAAGRFGKVDETYEYVKKLLEAAEQLGIEAQSFYVAVTKGTREQVVVAAKATTSKVLDVIDNAERLVKNEKDPVRKQLIQDYSEDLREQSKTVIKSAQTYRENPSSKENVEDFEAAFDELINSIQKLENITKIEKIEKPAAKLALSAVAMRNAANRVVIVAKQNPNNLQSTATALSAIADVVQTDILVAAATADAAEKKRLEVSSLAVKNASEKVATAMKKFQAAVSTPNQPVALKELTEAQLELVAAINSIKNAPVETKKNNDIVAAPLQEIAVLVEPGSETAKLLNAAEAQVQAATEFILEGEKLAGKVGDHGKQKQILLNVGEVKQANQKLSEAFKAVLQNPRDQSAQQKLTTAQSAIGDAIQKLVQGTTTQNHAEVASAMKEMSQETSVANNKVTSVLEIAQEILAAINLVFDESRELTPTQTVQESKELSKKSEILGTQLKAMAATTKDAAYKEKLLNAAKLTRDGALQIKILSAVKASGGSDRSNAVGMAAKALQSNILQIHQEVQAEGIRNKFRTTVQQTAAINKVAKLWVNQVAKK